VGADELTVLLAELADDLDAYLAARGGPGPHGLEALVAFNVEHADVELAHFGQDLLEQALAAGGRAADGYAPARQRCLDWALGAALGPVFDAPDAPAVLAAPALCPAWKSDLVLGDPAVGGCVTTAPSIAGWPLLTVPMGLVAGLPVGLALIAPPGQEEGLLAVGHAVARELTPGGLAPGWATAS
jgi:amidase